MNLNSYFSNRTFLFSFTSMGVFPTIFVLFLFFTLMCPIIHAAGSDETGAINCNIQESACTQSLGDGTVTLDIFPKPVKAMADLTFELILSGLTLTTAPYIDLGMPGMKMGPNHVLMKPSDQKHTYTGTGIIVRCPSGRTIWKADVTLPGVGSVEYVFDVIY